MRKGCKFAVAGVDMELYESGKPRQVMTPARRALVLHLVFELQLPSPAVAHVVTDWRRLAGGGGRRWRLAKRYSPPT